MAANTDWWFDTLKGESQTRQWDKLKFIGSGLNVIEMPGVWMIEAAAGYSAEVSKIPPKDQSKLALVYDTYLTNRGYNGGQLTATGKLWTIDQWNEFKTKIRDVWKPKKNTETSFQQWSLSHPVMGIMGIDTIAVTNFSSGPIVNGVWMVKFELTEWFNRAPPPRDSFGGNGKTGGYNNVATPPKSNGPAGT